MYAPFSFLAVKSKGKELRNVAYAEAMVNVIGNLLLIPTAIIIMGSKEDGVFGAIIASILSRFTHFVGLWYYYNKMVKS